MYAERLTERGVRLERNPYRKTKRNMLESSIIKMSLILFNNTNIVDGSMEMAETKAEVKVQQVYILYPLLTFKVKLFM
jgi:hypothetical protein